MALCNEGVDPTGEGKREGKGEGEGHCPAIAFPFISIQFLSCPFISFHLLSFLYPPGNDHISHQTGSSENHRLKFVPTGRGYVIVPSRINQPF